MYYLFLVGYLIKSTISYFSASTYQNQIKSNQINFIPIMGPRGANRNYTYSKITHINSQEGKS